MKNNRKYRVLAWLLCLVLAGNLCPAAAFARDFADEGRETSLTIEYPCPDALFHIFRVADISQTGEYTPAGVWKGYPVSFDQKEQSGWRKTAAALEGYARRDQLEPLALGTVDAGNSLKFSGLKTGLYLVIGFRTQYEDTVYQPESFLVSLPDCGADDRWEYDVTAKPKYQKNEKPGGSGGDPGEEKPGGGNPGGGNSGGSSGGGDSGSVPEKPGPVPGTTDIRVLKLWEDDEELEIRPHSVKVSLIRTDADGNSEVTDRCTLNEQNRWAHTWKDLDASCDWTIAEGEVSKYYTVSLDREGNTFLLTNTVKEEYLEKMKLPTGYMRGEDPLDLYGLGENGLPAGEMLPQTGNFWWAVPVLVCLGLICLMIGVTLRRRGEEDE